MTARIGSFQITLMSWDKWFKVQTNTLKTQKTIFTMCVDSLSRLLDLFKTNSRLPLSILALARNATGSCPSAEMRKRRSSTSIPQQRTALHLREDFPSWVTTRASGLVWARRASGLELPADAFWRRCSSTSDHRTDGSLHLRVEKSVNGSQSFVTLNYDLWLRWGMSPVFLRDTTIPKRPRLGQKESGTPLWIMCLTNVNIWKK